MYRMPRRDGGFSRSRFSPLQHLLFATVGSLLLLVASPNPGRAQTALLIQEMAETSDMTRRREICTQIQISQPKVWARRFCEGYDAVHVGLHREAEGALADMLSEQPNFALAAILYAEAYESLGDPKRAEPYYKWAIEVQPKRTDSRFSLGNLYLAQAEAGDESALPKALETFRQMAETDPGSPDGFGNMAHVLTLMGRFDDAEQLFQHAIEKDPADPFLHDNLAALYSRQGKNEEAAAAWQSALGVNPGYGAAVIELAALHGRQGDLVKAVRVLENGKQAVLAPPWGPRIRRNLGFAFLGMGDAERARNLFIEAVTAGSEDALAHLGLAHLRMLEGNTQAAMAAFRRGSSLDPELAKAFILPWKSTLKFALEEGESGALAEAISQMDAGTKPPDIDFAGKTGDATSPVLVTFVLEDWNLDDADLALDELEARTEAEGLAGFDGAPVPVTKVPAEYPERAQEQGIEGEVMVHVTIDDTGKVIEARIESSTADLSLNESALAAARQWIFEPATRYGAPVQSSIVIPFRFVKQVN